MAHSYLISGARTPIGSFLGSYKAFSATDLGAVAVAADTILSSIADRNPKRSFDHVTFGKPVLRRGAHSRSSRGSGGRDRFPIHLVLAQVGSAIISETENAFRTFRSVR